MSATTPSLVHEGVLYHLPAEGTVQSSISVEDLERQGIEFIRIQWVDLINNIRYRVVPLSYFEKLLTSSRPGVSLTKASLGLVFITIVEGFGATGDYLYALDLSSIRVCPYAPGHASIMGWFEEKAPAAGQEGHHSIEVDLCPRTILKRVVDNAKQISGVEFLIGFETEFILLKSTNPIEAVNPHGWSNSPALASGTKEADVLEEIARAIRASRIELQMYHAEAAPGQYEVVTGPLPPLQAVDALIHTREIIYNIASKHGLRATLAPRVFLDNTGSGAHVHISVHTRNGKARPSSTHLNLSDLEASFLAGVLDHLAGLTLLALPTPTSYQRMQDGVWSGGTYICWGTDNREAPLRLCNTQSPSSRNLELKTIDGTANPYLALAGVLGAGFGGIVESKELTMQDCNGGQSAASLGEKGRAELGIKERFPLTWEDARLKFEKSVIVDSLFGSDFKAKYLSTNTVFFYLHFLVCISLILCTL
ncbi:hypothetical protein BYT27DRAFT_7201038 [Phlegmacium glaucopus]|nr:hypothetical protein BYT27DRAFT_7201038 [Phlegmacium glaucopus]